MRSCPVGTPQGADNKMWVPWCEARRGAPLTQSNEDIKNSRWGAVQAPPSGPPRFSSNESLRIWPAGRVTAVTAGWVVGGGQGAFLRLSTCSATWQAPPISIHVVRRGKEPLQSDVWQAPPISIVHTQVLCLVLCRTSVASLLGLKNGQVATVRVASSDFRLR